MYNKEILSKRIKELRQEKNLTQRQLAEKANTTATSISAYEKGQKTPSIEVLCNIATVLETSVDWLCGNEVSKPICTYADIIKSLLSALADIDFIIIDCEDDFEYRFGEIDGTFIDIRDKVIEQFLKEYRKMKSVHDEGIINDDMLNSWLDGQYLKYDIPIADNQEN